MDFWYSRRYCCGKKKNEEFEVPIVYQIIRLKPKKIFIHILQKHDEYNLMLKYKMRIEYIFYH